MTPMVASRSTTPRKTPPSPIRSIIWSLISDLHPDHLAQPQRADGEVHDEEHDEEDPGRVGPELRDVLVPDQQQVEEEKRRKPAENPWGQAALGRQPPPLPPQPLTFAQRGGHGGQDLGEVATDLALDGDGHDDPLAVHAA